MKRYKSLKEKQDSIEKIKAKIDKVIKTGSKKFSNYPGDSSRAKETKYYNQLETRYIDLIELLYKHPDFKTSGIDKELYSVDNFGEFVF